MLKRVLRYASDNKNKAFIILLSLVLLMHVGLSVYYGNQKEGFHLDEIYSFTYASGYKDEIKLENSYNKWLDTEYFLDRVAQFRHRFSYLTLLDGFKAGYMNSYYIVLHTFGSFYFESIEHVNPLTFFETYKWFALIPNILISCLTLVFIYLFLNKMFRNKILSLIACVFWALSPAAITNVMYIRNYVLKTLLCVILMYTIALIDEKPNSKTGYSLFSSILFIGILTHPYFLVFAFFASFFYTLILFIKRHWLPLIKYIVANAISLIAPLLISPSYYSTIMTSNRGTEAKTLLVDFSSFGRNMITDIEYANRSVFSTKGIWLFAIIVFIILIVFASRLFSSKTLLEYKEKFPGIIKRSAAKQEGSFFSHIKKSFIYNNTLFCVTIFTVVFYFLLISKIAPYHGRYHYCIYPFISIISTVLLHWLLVRIKLPQVKAAVLLVLLFTLLNFLGLRQGNVEYLYPGSRARIEMTANLSDLTAIFVARGKAVYFICERIPELMIHDQVYYYRNKNMKKLQKALNSRDVTDEIVCYIHYRYLSETKDILDEIIKNTEFTKWEEIYNIDDRAAYLLTK